MKLVSKITVALSCLTLLASCSLIIGTLPNDPLFQVASGWGPLNDRSECSVLNSGDKECESIAERVRKYLVRSLPSSSHNLVAQYEAMGFSCARHSYSKQVGWVCSYTKSQAPATCVTPIRVVVSATFPEGKPNVEESELLVKSLAVQDIKNVDNRGCMPL